MNTNANFSWTLARTAESSKEHHIYGIKTIDCPFMTGDWYFCNVLSIYSAFRTPASYVTEQVYNALKEIASLFDDFAKPLEKQEYLYEGPYHCISLYRELY